MNNAIATASIYDFFFLFHNKKMQITCSLTDFLQIATVVTCDVYAKLRNAF
jgi:hypothetical protein